MLLPCEAALEAAIATTLKNIKVWPGTDLWAVHEAAIRVGNEKLKECRAKNAVCEGCGEGGA